MTFIYYLTENDIPVYVGKGKNLNRRESNHRWRTQNYNLNIHEIDCIEDDDWRFYEKYWISQFKSWGFNLQNKNGGGGGLHNMPLDSIEASRAGRKGQKRPTTSAKLKGITRSEEVKAKIGNANRGKPKPKGFNEKSIVQLDTQGRFIRLWDSIKAASLGVGANRNYICAVLNKYKYAHTAGGFKWKYKEEYESNI
tara:strand:+ start:42 stop:629 length:588 start_codon:yes stop_codon:yes gene_type:complete